MFCFLFSNCYYAFFGRIMTIVDPKFLVFSRQLSKYWQSYIVPLLQVYWFKMISTKTRNFSKNHPHTTYSWNIKWQKCAGISGLWVLNEIIQKNILKIWKKSWEPLGSYLLNSTANPAHFHPYWAGLAVLFSRLAGTNWSNGQSESWIGTAWNDIICSENQPSICEMI